MKTDMERDIINKGLRRRGTEDQRTRKSGRQSQGRIEGVVSGTADVIVYGRSFNLSKIDLSLPLAEIECLN
jgi:hypothetical protein